MDRKSSELGRFQRLPSTWPNHIGVALAYRSPAASSWTDTVWDAIQPLLAELADDPAPSRGGDPGR